MILFALINLRYKLEILHGYFHVCVSDSLSTQMTQITKKTNIGVENKTFWHQMFWRHEPTVAMVPRDTNVTFCPRISIF